MSISRMDSVQITTDSFSSSCQGAEGIRGLKGGKGEKVNTHRSVWLTGAILPGCNCASARGSVRDTEWKKSQMSARSGSTALKPPGCNGVWQVRQVRGSLRGRWSLAVSFWDVVLMCGGRRKKRLLQTWAAQKLNWSNACRVSNVGHVLVVDVECKVHVLWFLLQAMSIFYGTVLGRDCKRKWKSVATRVSNDAVQCMCHVAHLKPQVFVLKLGGKLACSLILPLGVSIVQIRKERISKLLEYRRCSSGH